MIRTKFRNWDGIQYEVKLKKPHKAQCADGLCDYPEQFECNSILVNPHLKERWVLETIIHEMIHAYQWDLSETKVNTLARSITRVIYDLGGEIHFEYKDDDIDLIEKTWRKMKPSRKKVLKKKLE